ncbi:response regulator [Roseateles sp. DAIF2]|uniref:ATP-binding protein n=1 Tax=Roseateles sp. DAIF2 TaxID=2714952 RepID=UPI0018A2B898|nr:ATP-binding protein [Roseateles sp. DAIF2]QPF75626.1 response regulator [Roseateles sp. DAIF2]
MAACPPGAEAPSANFVAVPGAARDNETPPIDPMGREHRALLQRLQDAAFAETWACWPYLLLAVALPILAQAMAPAIDLGAALWLAGVVVTSLGCALTARSVLHPFRRPGRDTRRGHRLLLWQGLACLLLLSMHPWLADGPGPRAPLAGPLLAASALVLALVLAPLGRATVIVALLPVSEGLARLNEAHGIEWPGVAYFATALAVIALALLEQQRWHRMQRSLMQGHDRIRQLEQARNDAIRADQEKSRFLAIASHDLRQPVHALGLFAATLEKRLQGSEEEPLMRNVMRSIDGLERSFNAMLDISRLDAGTIEPNIQHFPLRDLFRRLHMHYAGQAEAKSLGLRFSPGGKSVSSDPQLLERIVGNLIQNALKYTEQGGVVVVARSTPTHTHLEVWDTGIGIRAGDLPRIFDEFYQVGHGERSRAQGLGMGLAIVKRLAHLLGYRLTVASRPGHGTRFRLSIPLGGLAEIQDATAAADTLPMTVIQPRSVLVIDDEPSIREGLRVLLEEWGYEAVLASTLNEAVQAVRALGAAPDLILSDLHLGDCPDGIATIEAVRRLCGHAVPAILVTGDTSHDELRRASDSGHQVLFKPLQPRRLFNALRGMVS